MRNMVFSASGGDADVERTLLKFGDDLIGIQTKAAAAVSNSGIYKSIKDAITNSTVTPAEAVSLINQNATVLGEADRSRLLAFARNQDPRNKDVDKRLAIIIDETIDDKVERGDLQAFLDNALQDITDPDARFATGNEVLKEAFKNRAIYKSILRIALLSDKNILIKTSMNLRNVIVFLYKKVIYLTNERHTCKVLLFILIKV